MCNVLKLVSPIPVSVNHYLKPRGFLTKNKKVMVTMYETADAKKYKKEFIKYIKEEIKKQKFVHLPNKTQHFYVDCDFYFARIDQDANNYFKIMLDAITDTGMIWVDDNVTCERVNKILYDNKNPRIELTIRPVEYVGIFDNNEQLELFKNRCTSCSRYRGGVCSILKKAIEGRVQEDIDMQNFNCIKYKEKKK